MTLRIVLSHAAMFDWLVFHMDVNNAFLQGELNEDIYMHLPQGYIHQKGGVAGCV